MNITDGSIGSSAVTGGAGGSTGGAAGQGIGSGIFLAGPVQYSVTGGTVTISDTLGGGTNALITGGFTKAGVGTLALSGTNTYVGGATISGGVMRLDAAGALPGGIGAAGGTTNLAFNGGVLGLNMATNFNRGLGTGATQVQWTGSGGFAAYGAARTVNVGGAAATMTWNSGSFVPTSSALILSADDADDTITFQNPIDFNGAVRTIQTNNGSSSIDAILSGALTGSGGLEKTGQGTLNVTNAGNNYSGATNINAGTLLVNGTHTGGGLYSVNNNGTLGGSGTILAAVDINNGGTISPGNSPGNLNTGAENWNGGGNFLFEINDVDAGPGTDPGWDLLTISGALTINATSGNPFDILLTSLTLGNVAGVVHDFVAAGSYSWLIADATATISTYSGTNQFNVDTTAFQNAFTGTFSVVRGDTVSGGDDSQLYLSYSNEAPPAIVPEPSSIALGLCGLTGLLGMVWARRRRPRK